MNRTGFCIYINTVCEGPVPLWRDGHGNPVVYQSEVEVQREIAEDTIERLQQFLEGQRDFVNAMTVEEYILEVDVWPDGSITDGNWFGAGHW